MTDSAKPEEQPVDDVWKAAAYGNLDRTKDFIQTDPQLVNKPDATGYANFTRQIQPDADSAPQVKSSDSFVFQLPRDLPPFRSRTFKLPFHPPFTTRFLPLQWAALNNRVAVATFLIERGAAVNATDNDKQTPLHWACVRGSLPCAELLLRHGARLRRGGALRRWELVLARRPERRRELRAVVQRSRLGRDRRKRLHCLSV